MSRVGNNPVTIPSSVTVEIKDGVVLAKGPKGELQTPVAQNIEIAIQDGMAVFTRKNEEKKSKSNHGLMRALVQNMVTGVSEGFTKKLEVNGVGFKSSVSGKNLKLSLGFSHDIQYKVPDNVEVSADQNVITVSGIDRQAVGQVAATIREFKKPEPYKGKGIKYEDEYVIRKAGKTAGSE